MPSHTYAHNYTALIVFEHTFMIDMSLMGGLGTKSYIGLFYSVYPNRFIVFLSGQTITFHSCTLCFIAAKSESLMCLNTFFFYCIHIFMYQFFFSVCVCVAKLFGYQWTLQVFSHNAAGLPPPNIPPQVQEDFSTSSCKLVQLSLQECRFKPSQYVDKICTYIQRKLDLVCKEMQV